MRIIAYAWLSTCVAALGNIYITDSQKGIKVIPMRNPTTVPKVIPIQNQLDSLGESKA